MGQISEMLPLQGVPYMNVRLSAENVHEFRALREEFLREFPEYDPGLTSEGSVVSETAVANGYVGVDVEDPETPLTVAEIQARLNATPITTEVSSAKAAFLKKKEG